MHSLIATAMQYVRNVIISFLGTFGTFFAVVPISSDLVSVSPDFRTTIALIVSSLTGLFSIVVTTICRDFLESRREKRKRVSDYNNYLTQRYEEDNPSNPQIAARHSHVTTADNGHNSHN